MTFDEALDKLRADRSLKMRLPGWKADWWVREIDLYTDTEFRVTEQPNAVGTFLPFLVWHTSDGKLSTWHPGKSDIECDAWRVIS